MPRIRMPTPAEPAESGCRRTPLNPSSRSLTLPGARSSCSSTSSRPATSEYVGVADAWRSFLFDVTATSTGFEIVFAGALAGVGAGAGGGVGAAPAGAGPRVVVAAGAGATGIGAGEVATCWTGACDGGPFAIDV